MMEIAREWLSWFGREDAHLRLIRAMGFGDGEADRAAFLWLTRIGAFAAGILSEDDKTVPAPRFRFAGEHDYYVTALVWPVYGDRLCSLSFGATGDADARLARIVADASDLVATVFPSGRCYSLTGFTCAVGDFAEDETGRVTVRGSGRGWIEAQLARVKALAFDMPAHVAAAQAEEPSETLLLAPRAFDWSGVMAPREPWPLPAGAKSLVVPDSRGLAALLAAAMKLPARRCERPKLFGPRSK